MAANVVEQLVCELEGRRPRAEILKLAVEPTFIQTRGVRSFGFRLETEAGQLYLMAELPNWVEMEHAKDTEYFNGMVKRYMPRNWESGEGIKSRREIDNFLILARKAECDIQLRVQNADGSATTYSGFMVEQCSVDGERGMKISSELAEPGGGVLRVGETVYAQVGLNNRSVEFTCEFQGRSEYSIVDGAVLNCMMFSLPEKLAIQQRRKAFRIEVQNEILVEFESVKLKTDDPLAQALEDLEPGVTGKLEDISFSGARIVGHWPQSEDRFTEGAQISCRIFFPEESEPLQVIAMVRRSTTNLLDRNNWQHNLGIEFVVTPDMEMTSLYFIREYVLSQQRAELARRVSVSGVDQW